MIRFSALFCCVFRPCNNLHPSVSLAPYLFHALFRLHEHSGVSDREIGSSNLCIDGFCLTLSSLPATLQCERSLIPHSVYFPSWTIFIVWILFSPTRSLLHSAQYSTQWEIFLFEAVSLASLDLQYRWNEAHGTIHYLLGPG